MSRICICQPLFSRVQPGRGRSALQRQPPEEDRPAGASSRAGHALLAGGCVHRSFHFANGPCEQAPRRVVVAGSFRRVFVVGSNGEPNGIRQVGASDCAQARKRLRITNTGVLCLDPDRSNVRRAHVVLVERLGLGQVATDKQVQLRPHALFTSSAIPPLAAVRREHVHTVQRQGPVCGCCTFSSLESSTP